MFTFHEFLDSALPLFLHAILNRIVATSVLYLIVFFSLQLGPLVVVGFPPNLRGRVRENRAYRGRAEAGGGLSRAGRGRMRGPRVNAEELSEV